MNVPNKITLSRILLIPFFIIAVLKGFMLVGGILFFIAAVTDGLDGYYARKYNQVTTLGKFLDPLADKLLVSAALVLLVQLQLIPSWVVILIISREFAVTGMRLVLAGEGEVVAASFLGKIKTVTQIIAILGFLANVQMIAVPMLYIALIATIYSGYDYFVKNARTLLASA